MSFGSVSATDADGLGDIVYGLSETSEFFQIDNSTGKLSLVQALDFETQSVEHWLSSSYIPSFFLSFFSSLSVLHTSFTFFTLFTFLPLYSSNTSILSAALPYFFLSLVYTPPLGKRTH